MSESSTRSDNLYAKTQEIKDILSNLKSPLIDKNNKLISNENIDKFLNYTEEIKLIRNYKRKNRDTGQTDNGFEFTNRLSWNTRNSKQVLQTILIST